MVRTTAETVRECRFCPMCRDTCTTGEASTLESLTARGFAILIDYWQRQGFFPPGGAEAIYACTQCGLCEATCVTRHPLPDAILTARQWLVTNNRVPAEVRRAYETVSDAAGRTKRSASLPHKDDLAGRGVVFDPGGWEDEAGAAPTAASLQRLAEHYGVPYRVLEGAPVCVHLVADMGYQDRAVAMAREHVRAVAESGARQLVTACSQCYDTFKRRYPAWGVAWPEGVEALHVAEWLNGLAGLPAQSTAAGVWYYHDDDSLARRSKLHDAPRAVMEKLLPGHWQELPRCRERAVSGGAAGATWLVRPDLATKAAVRLFSCMTDVTGSEQELHLVTACILSARHLANVARTTGAPVRVWHLAELAVAAVLKLGGISA